MKKLIYAFLFMAISLVACKKYQGDIPQIHPVKFSISTTYASDDLAKVLPKAQ